MARNVEIKLRVGKLEPIAEKLKELEAEGPWILQQRDTFYHCENGRLKMRRQEGKTAELIFYQRADSNEARLSDYSILKLQDADEAHELLAKAYGSLGEVVKTRWLYLIDQSRIHLDQVMSLGTFIELEVVLEDDQSIDYGQEVAREVMRQLGLAEEEPVPQAYFDLLRQANS